MRASESTIQELITVASSNPNYFCNSVGRLHDFYLTGVIGPAEEYLQWFQTIRNAGETDVIVIHINSYGGDMMTAIQLMQAIGETDATVVCSVEGACMSAATIVFLSGEQYQLNEFSVFMFHNYSGMNIGKGGEMFDAISHERVWSNNLLRKVYDGFLTKKELSAIMENKDIWMNADDVIKRLEKRNARLKKAHEQEQDLED